MTPVRWGSSPWGRGGWPGSVAVDPCSAQNSLLARIRTEIWRKDNTNATKVTRVRALLPKVG